MVEKEVIPVQQQLRTDSLGIPDQLAILAAQDKKVITVRESLKTIIGVAFLERKGDSGHVVTAAAVAAAPAEVFSLLHFLEVPVAAVAAAAIQARAEEQAIRGEAVLVFL